jgi:hypothetical protein
VRSVNSVSLTEISVVKPGPFFLALVQRYFVDGFHNQRRLKTSISANNGQSHVISGTFDSMQLDSFADTDSNANKRIDHTKDKMYRIN